jgi:hypothetical protein
MEVNAGGVLNLKQLLYEFALQIRLGTTRRELDAFHINI